MQIGINNHKKTTGPVCKECGMVFVHHYVHDAGYHGYCDETGMPAWPALIRWCKVITCTRCGKIVKLSHRAW